VMFSVLTAFLSSLHYLDLSSRVPNQHGFTIDRGAIGMDSSFRIVVSSRLHGGGLLSDLFLRLHGKSVILPSRKLAFPRQEYIEWHRHEVFRGEPRD
jgi:putative restriction endonuclease